MEAGDALQEREMGGERTSGEIPRTVRGDGRGREMEDVEGGDRQETERNQI